MSKCRDFLKDKWMYIAAILIPWCIALIHSAIADTWVTGHGNIAAGDLQGQLIPIAYEIWDRFHAGDWNSSFTWHLQGGINFGNLTGYYRSPFTLIMLLIPRNLIADYMQLTMLAKWSLCAWSMTFFFYHTRFNIMTVHKKAVSLFLGMAYVLGNSIMSYILYVQFMDVLICFPLLLLLIEEMTERKKWKLYYPVLTFVIWSNMYLAYEVCIFLVIWFFLNFSMTKEERLKKFMMFAMGSFLSGFTWLAGALGGVSAAQQRYESTSTSTVSDYVKEMLIKPWEFIKQLFLFRDIEGAASFLPNIFFSVTALMLIMLIPAVKIEIKRKIYIFAITVFLIISFFSGKLSMFWHVFNTPNGFYHRFMFLFTFWMLFLALLVITHFEDVRIWHMIISTAVMVMLYVYVLMNLEIKDSYLTYIVTILMIVFLFLMFIFHKRGSIQFRNLVCILVICGVGELVANAYYTFSFYDEVLMYGKGGLVEDALEALSGISLEPGERMVSQSPTPNISMIAGMNSDCGFLSSLNASNKLLHEKLGMTSNSSVEAGTRGGSPLINLLFNIRYGQGESELLFSDCEPVTTNTNWPVYRMKRLAGLGYMVDNTITEWNAEDKNCFQFQNDFIRKAVGGEDVFTPAHVDVTCHDNYGLVYNREEEYIPYGAYAYKYEALTEDRDDYIQLDITMEESADLYMFYRGSGMYTIYVFIDGEMVHRDVRRFIQETLHIGEVKEGQEISVIAVPAFNYSIGDSMGLSFNFAKYDEAAYSKAYEQLSRNTYEIETERSNYIKGTIRTDEQGIMMTSIPASGFQVFVDGDQTEYVLVGGAFIGVPVGKGEHTVEFLHETSHRDTIMAVIVMGVYCLICVVEGIRHKRTV